MKFVKWTFAAVWLFIGAACQDSEVDPNGPVTLTNSDFRTDTDGWVAEVTDYSTAQESIIEFQSGLKALPAPLDATKKSFMTSGHNRSDDLFMFLKKKVTGLKPNQTYLIDFEIELASQYGTNSVGIGGSPGGSVYLKAGVSATEPKKVKEGDDYRLNIDKGNQMEGSAAVPVLGNIGAGDDVTQYKLIQRTTSEPIMAKTNDAGELWLLVGTDSGFEGLTTLYYNKIKAVAELK
ncbi:hypothetical protein GCM10028803_14440 [Larkinella knui]|uniref:Lipoprotein n=1 Tax=Larkinella knui TaxID=2025310 RepID=A0A3P1CC08_9BACT|nr:hypothetical protein [Larkinella knui]RRB10616.1 hypothetical protein EHT87_25975 [Larkinella knui]